jgi:hypothetical protein
MGHSYNNGLHTSSKGITVDAVRVTGLDTSPCTIAEDCKSGLISAVTKGVTGTYTFQLTAPYPPKLVVCLPDISAAAVTSDILTAKYKDASYNATTGQFVVFVSNDDDSGAPVAADGASTNELHVFLMFNRYTR